MKNTKRKYVAPKAEQVKIDKNITVSMMSLPPGDPGTSTDFNPFKL